MDEKNTFQLTAELTEFTSGFNFNQLSYQLIHNF